MLTGNFTRMKSITWSPMRPANSCFPNESNPIEFETMIWILFSRVKNSPYVGVQKSHLRICQEQTFHWLFHHGFCWFGRLQTEFNEFIE